MITFTIRPSVTVAGKPEPRTVEAPGSSLSIAQASALARRLTQAANEMTAELGDAGAVNYEEK